MQRHLRMHECTDVQKQVLATFKLVGSALQWWESITTAEERDTLTIQEFWVRFDRKYFPSAVHTEMRRKLMSLKQEGKTVAEYEAEFTNLLNIVPDEIPTEKKKIKKFTDGLNWRIRQHLLGNLSLATYSDVVNAALLHCQDHRFHMAEGKRSGESSHQGRTGGHGASGAQTGQGQRQTEQGTQQGDNKRFRSGNYRQGQGGFRQGHQGPNGHQG